MVSYRVFGLVLGCEDLNDHDGLRKDPVTILAGQLLTHFGVQLTGKGHLDADDRIVAFVGHRLQVAGEAAVGCGEVTISEATGYFLLDLAHAQVAFGAIIGEGDVLPCASCAIPRQTIVRTRLSMR